MMALEQAREYLEQLGLTEAAAALGWIHECLCREVECH